MVYRVKGGKPEETACYGKAKEFFIFWYNTETGESWFTEEQREFARNHYPFTLDVAPLFIKLYDLAEYLEGVKRTLAWQAAKVIPTSKPQLTEAKVVGPRIEVSERKAKRRRRAILAGKEESVIDD